MKKLLALIFGTVVAFSAMCQVPALNEIVKTNTLSPSRVGAALEAAEVYTASGTDTYTVSISVTGLYSGAATYASGDQFTIVFTNANATTTPTLNVNSEGAIIIVDNKGDAVAAGDIEGALKLMYDGTNFRVIGGTGSGGGGGAGTVTSVGIATGTSGTDFNVSGSPVTTSGNITLNFPSASATNRGLLLAADWSTFNGKQSTITFGTGVQTALGVNVGSAGAPVLFNGALGTPSSGSASNLTGTTAATATSNTNLATNAFVQQEIDARVEDRTYKFGDEASPVTATTGKLTTEWPFDNTTITEVSVFLSTAQTSGSIFTVDINKNGTTILSTKITVDNTERTSLTAVTAPVLSVTTLSRGDILTYDVDQVGDNTAKGPEVHLRYIRP